MRLSILTAVSLMVAQGAVGAEAYRLGGKPVDAYTITYPTRADHNEGVDRANDLQGRLRQLTSKENPITAATAKRKSGTTIALTKPDGMGTFEYKIDVQKGRATVSAGSSWAMNRAIDLLIERIKQGEANAPLSLKGTVEGEVLFPRTDGTTLRILDDNIWEYVEDTIPQVWHQAGIDCRDAARAPEFAQLVRAYMPEVVTFQEYAHHMHDELAPRLKKYGYRPAYKSPDEPWNYTPIFYQPDSLELLTAEYCLFTPKRWSNRGTKSYTAAVFRQRSTGKVFAVINTHLYWKNESMAPGSTNARAGQARLIMAEADHLVSKYDCPVFVTGDMNCYEGQLPMQQFVTSGYVPCYKAATVYGNNDNGHHICAPGEVGERTSRRASSTREEGAIDHCFIYNAKDSEVKRFDCIQDYFTVKLTDHYPNLIDVKL